MTMKLFLTLIVLITCSNSVVNGQIYANLLSQASKNNANFDKTPDLRKELYHLYHSSALRKILSDVNEFRDFAVTVNVSHQCKVAFEYAITNVNSSWTINMIDALAKPSSSLMMGAIHWLGGFEQCMRNQAPRPYVANLTAPRSRFCEVVIPAVEIIKRIPAFLQKSTFMIIGICIPDACTADDFTTMVQEIMYLAKYVYPNITSITPIPGCMKRKEDMEWSSAAIAMLVVCAIFGTLMLIGTVIDLFFVRQILKPMVLTIQNQSYEYYSNGDLDESDIKTDDNNLVDSESKGVNTKNQGENPHLLSTWKKIFVSFSVYSNTMKVFDTSQQPDRLNCLDGIRFLSMSWVILGHTYVFAISYINNPFSIGQRISKDWGYAAILNASFSVDTFFVLSGLLTAYMFLKEVHRIGSIARGKLWVTFFLHRYWRLTPPHLLFLGFYTALMAYFSSGPFWNQQGSIDSSACQHYWWKNVLYINNFNMSESCMAWTWYLANDMQFHYFIAPFILAAMFYFGIRGIAATTFPIILGSLIITGILAEHNGGLMPDGSENVYFRPWCRVNPYIMGLITGYIIYEYKRRNWKLHWTVVMTGWFVAAGFCLSTVYGPHGSESGAVVLSKDVGALYTSTSRLAWSIGVSWVIFACISGYGGWINRFLSWKFFIPLSRLTYCAYLVHPVVLFVFYSSLYSSPYVTSLSMAYYFIGHLVISYMVAFVVSLTWESPLMGLERILLKKQ